MDLSPLESFKKLADFLWYLFFCNKFTALIYKPCHICSTHEPKHTVKSTHRPSKYSRRTQLTRNSSAFTSEGRLITNEATPSLRLVTLFFGSKSDISWFTSTVCAFRMTGSSFTDWSSESLTCTCLQNNSDPFQQLIMPFKA